MEPPRVWAGVWEGPQTGSGPAQKAVCEGNVSFPNQKLQILPNSGKLKVENPNAIRLLDRDSDFGLSPGCEAHSLVTPTHGDMQLVMKNPPATEPC